MKMMQKYVERATASETHPGPRWKRYVGDSLLSITGVALITAAMQITNLSPKFPIISLLYLLVVLVLAGTRGMFAASIASLLAVLTYDFFFVTPYYQLEIQQLEDVITLGFFMAVAVLTSQLASALRWRAEQARNRESALRRLYEQAQELASLQERQRLARELHDSISQALYGINLGAHTAQECLESDPEQAQASLSYVLSLTEAGIAEMRALIFELRPESLETEGLVAALNKQVTILRTRYKLSVEARLDEEPEISLDLKHALYRIAQEALHNIVRHAQASHVTLSLTQHPGEIHLQIRDDGRGFDPSHPYPGHLGVRSMQERASKAGGTITVTSTSGQGTSITVCLPSCLLAPIAPASSLDRERIYKI
jgi:signal transduction histidine kinase